MYNNKKRNIDLLINHFWQSGYNVINRKFGTYLSEPPKIGNYDVDILGKFKKNYAIGICLNDDDVKNSKLLEKINYLATRKTRFSNKKVELLVGVTFNSYRFIRELINSLDDEAKKNIKIFVLDISSSSDLFEQPVFVSDERNFSFAH